VPPLRSSAFRLALAAVLALAPPARAEEGAAATVPPAPAAATASADPPTFLLELAAYYTSAGVYLPLRREPVPHVGERGELDLYWAILPRSVVPRFVVLEVSVNPMPCLGLLVRDRSPDLYGRSQLDAGTNLVRAVTAGFEEPWAASLFVGNVVNFDVPGSTDVEGKGYFGGVFSAGNWHIKDNVAVDDPWLETELKLKGDRRSRVKKLSWSFRVGVKLHSNDDVVDAAFVGIRRSRVDYAGAPTLLANSGVEYRFDAALDGRPLRHLLLVDKKWPLGTRVAASLALGVLWDEGRSYRGALAAGTPERLQVLVRPNVEF
jgi:hypothetical protein